MSSLSKRARRTSLWLVLTSIVLLALSVSSEAATWTPLTNAPPGGVGTMLLLTDGTVLAQQNGCGSTWFQLMPNSVGSYVNGTWSTKAAMGTGRLYFASHVLPNGKVWVLGGEYAGASCTAVWTNTGEIYDPVANTWTPIAPYPPTSGCPNSALACFGDDPSMLISTGKILAGSLTT